MRTKDRARRKMGIFGFDVPPAANAASIINKLKKLTPALILNPKP